jgi:large subunit ribosomal protein L6
MSRVGKLPIKLPQGVTVTLSDLHLSVKGPKGALNRQLHPDVQIEVGREVLQVRRADDTKMSRSLHGLTRALVNNMVLGVSQGFTKTLEIQGTGYRADLQGNVINFTLGYSHPIQFPLPDGVKATVERQTVIRLESIDKELLGLTATRIKALRAVEPYKGKGIRLSGQYVHRKAGKAGSKK